MHMQGRESLVTDGVSPCVTLPIAKVAAAPSGP